ncbi:peptide ABC transporter substrate-binding protein [Agilicoccus flavus]|uniref:peptide ABC transporter substrate-binding protein n=1 Tax=Agilicoccus flavus TaxID=2775968 RepID=UPI001CF664D3|nr:ABC transporter substrate-binding protein [Agilicoccus flavus]
MRARNVHEGEHRLRRASARIPSRPRRAATALAVGVLTAATGLAGCSPAPAPSPPATPSATPTPTTPVSVNTRALAGSLLPADVSDAATARVAALLFRGLVRYDAKGKAQNEVAESITTSDDRVYRVSLEPGWTFSNGSPVTSSSFVDAWNLAARRSSGFYRAYAFSPIVGYDAVRAPAGPAAREDLAGLDVLDARTFTITLDDPDPTFPERLGDPAFAPLPPAALADPASFAAAPVGNGPYRLQTGRWPATGPAASASTGASSSPAGTGSAPATSSTPSVPPEAPATSATTQAAPTTAGARSGSPTVPPGTRVRLAPNASYTGGEPARNSAIDLVVYADLDAAYRDFVAGRLDVLDGVAPDRLTEYRQVAEKRAVNQPVGVTDSLVFPLQRAPWTGEAGRQRRLAVSRAVDRAAIARDTFAGTRLAATDLAAPVVEGSSQDLCGAACTHDPAAAAELLREVGGLDDLTIAYAGDGDHGALVTALCADVTTALRIGCRGKPYPNEIALSEALALGTETGPHLQTWRMSRPALAAFLDPRFVPGAAPNTSGYADDVVATHLGTAATASAAGQPQAFQDVEREIMADLPIVPLWSVNATGASSADLGPVRTDAFGAPILGEITRGGG